MYFTKNGFFPIESNSKNYEKCKKNCLIIWKTSHTYLDKTV